MIVTLRGACKHDRYARYQGIDTWSILCNYKFKKSKFFKVSRWNFRKWYEPFGKFTARSNTFPTYTRRSRSKIIQREDRSFSGARVDPVNVWKKKKKEKGGSSKLAGDAGRTRRARGVGVGWKNSVETGTRDWIEARGDCARLAEILVTEDVNSSERKETGYRNQREGERERERGEKIV